jgi:hypothetical protein
VDGEHVQPQISGGLDSFIVLGCLGDAPGKPAICCYTDCLYWRRPWSWLGRRGRGGFGLANDLQFAGRGDA